MIRTATLSPCGLYRYTLTREWDPALPRVLFVMLNPSTADADVDDPTIRCCIGFAKRDGFGSLEVVNLYAYRSTSPADLWSAQRIGRDIVGPENYPATVGGIERSAVYVAAWGAHIGEPRQRAVQVSTPVRLTLHRGGLSCLGTTKDGHPRHPLYLRSDAALMPWRMP